MVRNLVVDALTDMFVGDVDLSFWFAVVGLFVLMGEALVPGGTFMVLGTGLMLAGVTGVLVPGVGSLLQLSLLAGVYGAVAFLLFRNFDIFGERGPQTSDRLRLQGAEGVVEQPVTTDAGRVKLRQGFDPHFTARSYTGERIPEGTRVKVVDPRGGNVLDVAPVDEADGLIREHNEESSR